MSIIFGIANLDDVSVEHATLLGLARRTGGYAPDGTFVHTDGGIGMGFQPYHTTARSRLEVQPYLDVHENILAFDGRLDNHEELAQLLYLASERATDSSLILTAFERWGEACFERFVGDWALALWAAEYRKLYLARDHAGTRTLYYQLRGSRVVWSTYLEAFLDPHETRTLDDEFAARYLGGLPIRASTPYAGIRAVPPAHALIFGKHAVRARAHWNCMITERLIYKDVQEYDDQFMECFERSVRRREMPCVPILAELSGGMDSTAIVCTSDFLRRRSNRDVPILDTVSYYDNFEPDWNELPYVTATESYRGKTGIHISTSYLDRNYAPPNQNHPLYPSPGVDENSFQREQEFNRLVAPGGYRVILSGLGGDELLGGVPTPYPELSDHLARLRFCMLGRRTTEWCLASREPFFHVLARTFSRTFNQYRHAFDTKTIVPWVSPYVRDRCIELASQEEKQWPHTAFLPSSIDSARSWSAILETLPHLYPKLSIRREYRYPYLDKDLASYLLRVPREQLVQPSRKRVLMRRALRHCMPNEVVERRRKAFVARGPYALIQRERANIELLLSSSRLEALGLIDLPSLKKVLSCVYSGTETQWSRGLLSVLSFELWLRRIDDSRVLFKEEDVSSTQGIDAYKIPTPQVASRSAS